MPTVDVLVESECSRSTRARQVEALFDVPLREKTRLSWVGNVPLEERDWSVGLIVGPSGAGKSTIARQLFGEAYEPQMTWGASSVIDDIADRIAVKDICDAFASVGFNTIPAWLRPHRVLSNGERFRVDLARRLLELPDPIVVDEFTSVVDRQVAQIGSHAVQKFVRRNKRKFVAVTCHYDVIDWLQPDWIFEPATMSFQWRLLQRRPDIDIEIARVPYSTWQIFAPFHYMSSELNKAAACFGLWANGHFASFCAVLHRPHPKARNLKAASRTVTLPDWQGLGLAFVLVDTIASAYVAHGFRFRSYPAHPSFIRARARSKNWRLDKKPGENGYSMHSAVQSLGRLNAKCNIGSRLGAVFEYVGEPMADRVAAAKLIGG